MSASVCVCVCYEVCSACPGLAAIVAVSACGRPLTTGTYKLQLSPATIAAAESRTLVANLNPLGPGPDYRILSQTLPWFSILNPNTWLGPGLFLTGYSPEKSSRTLSKRFRPELEYYPHPSLHQTLFQR